MEPVCPLHQSFSICQNKVLFIVYRVPVSNGFTKKNIQKLSAHYFSNQYRNVQLV